MLPDPLLRPGQRRFEMVDGKVGSGTDVEGGQGDVDFALAGVVIGARGVGEEEDHAFAVGGC